MCRHFGQKMGSLQISVETGGCTIQMCKKRRIKQKHTITILQKSALLISMFCFETMFAWFQQSSSKVNRGSCNSSINWLQNAQGEKKKNVLAGNWEIDIFALFLWRSAKIWKIDLRSFNLTPFQTRSIVQFSDVSIFFCFLFHRIYPNFAKVKSQCIFKLILYWNL